MAQNCQMTRRNKVAKGLLGGEVDRLFQHFSDQSGDGRAFAAGQGDVSEERMAFQRFDHCNNSVMAADPQVIALGNIVGQDNSGILADAGENGEQDSPF